MFPAYSVRNSQRLSVPGIFCQNFDGTNGNVRNNSKLRTTYARGAGFQHRKKMFDGLFAEIRLIENKLAHGDNKPSLHKNPTE